MKDAATAFPYDLHRLGRAAWIDRVGDIGADAGDATPLGATNMSVFVDAGRTLLVAFENIRDIRANAADRAPIGWGFVQRHGWSSLSILARNETDWFRDPALFHHFDRLIDDGFFDDFDNVLFYGAGAAGYAAGAFSVAAPDARVLLIQPQATLDPAKTRWDRRHPQARRMDFTTRYGFAPDMVETAEQVWVIHDPSVIEDSMHAALFDGNNTGHLSCGYVGPDAQVALSAMGVLPRLIEQAMSATLDRTSYAKLWRARQSYLPYLRTLMHRVEADGMHDGLLEQMCRTLAKGQYHTLFAKKLAQRDARETTPAP